MENRRNGPRMEFRFTDRGFLGFAVISSRDFASSTAIDPRIVKKLAKSWNRVNALPMMDEN